jgi:hypothetical protein
VAQLDAVATVNSYRAGGYYHHYSASVGNGFRVSKFIEAYLLFV